MRINITEQLLDRLTEIEKQQLPESIKQQVIGCLLDYFAVTVAGAQILKEKNKKYISYVQSCGKVAVYGTDERTDIYTAIFLNGMNAHASELDDGHRFGMLHLGAVILSALLPVVECRKITFEQAAKGIVAGYEAAVLLARAVQPSHKKRGYHTTGTCGCLGAAAAIGVMLSFSREQLRTALAAAASSAAGLLEMQEDSSQLKPFNVARAAVDGYLSALTGESGYIGPVDPIGGKRGFIKVLSQEDHGLVVEKDYYAIAGIYRKLYASCRHSHSAIEAALILRKKYSIQPNQIDKIVIHIYQAAILGHDHISIQGASSARMSIPYSVAVALFTGQAGIREFEGDRLNDLRILKLAEKIQVREDKALTALAPTRRAARVEIYLENGEMMEEQIDYPKGEPENPILLKDIEEKYRQLCEFAGIEEKKRQALMQALQEWCNGGRKGIV